MDTIRVARVRPEAILPTRKYPTDAGMDFYAYGDHYIVSHMSGLVRTGVTVEIPEGHMMLLKPKGGSGHLIGAGVIDPRYEPGEILIRVFNTSTSCKVVYHGEAIAQGVIIPIVVPRRILEVPVETFVGGHDRSGKGAILDART